MQFHCMNEAQVDEHAMRAAEYFWWTSRDDVTSPKLVKEDLEPYLGSEEEVDYMFNLFDHNGDGFVVFEEVEQQFINLYRCALPSPLGLPTACSLSALVLHVCGMSQECMRESAR